MTDLELSHLFWLRLASAAWMTQKLELRPCVPTALSTICLQSWGGREEGRENVKGVSEGGEGGREDVKEVSEGERNEREGGRMRK